MPAVRSIRHIREGNVLRIELPNSNVLTLTPQQVNLWRVQHPSGTPEEFTEVLRTLVVASGVTFNVRCTNLAHSEYDDLPYIEIEAR